MLWHLVLNWLGGHWLLAGPAVLALLCGVAPAIGFAVLRWLVGTRPGVLLLCAYAALALVLWARSQAYAQGVADTRATLQPVADRAALKAERAARAEEATRTRYLAGVDAAYQRGLSDANAAVAGVLDDVRAGRYVLRQSLRCPAVRSAPASPAGAGQRDDAAAGVLPDATVLDLVRLAGDADGVRQQLIACQSVVRADRAEVTP